MEAERKIKKAKIDLMRAQMPGLRLWAGVMMVGKTSVVDDMPTACTNGRDEFYGREFIDSLKPKEINFVVLHENMHKGKRDLTTWKKLADEDMRLANMALDYVINLAIVAIDPSENVVAMPRKPDGSCIGLYDERFKGMNSKQVFDILKQEQEEGGSGGGSGGDGSGGGGLDDHDWDGAKELSPKEKEELAKEIDRALRQGEMEARKMGSGAGGMDITIENLLRPQIDWKEALREFVTSLCVNKDTSSWRRVSRRYLSNDIYMPTLVGESLGHIVIGADMSGSTWVGNTMKTIFTELVSLCQAVTPERLDLIYWDAVVAGHEEYKAGDYEALLESTKPKGGGGTDPKCVSNYLHEKNIKPDCIVMVTDGYVPNWGNDWPAPVLWVVIGNKVCADNGKTIHITEE
jgi:predicted metal-dependent peptidase